MKKNNLRDLSSKRIVKSIQVWFLSSINTISYEAGEVQRSSSWREFVWDGDFLYVALVPHDVQALDDAAIRVVCRGQIHADCCSVAVDLQWSGGSRPHVLCRERTYRLRVDVDFGGGQGSGVGHDFSTDARGGGGHCGAYNVCEGLKNIWTISTVFKLQIKYLCDFDTHNYLVVHIII